METLGRQLFLTFKAMRDRLESALASVGTSVPQWILLRTVHDEPGLSQRELAGRIHTAGSTLTHHLDRLERDGHILRTRDDQDRRILRITLTDAGEARLDQLTAVVGDHDRHLRSLLPAGDDEALRALLAVLAQRLQETPNPFQTPAEETGS
jgi:DNA-binding MarR family transcriptional regulator